MQIQVKDIKCSQRFFDEQGEYKAFKDAELVDGKWQCEATDRGDYEWLFHEGAEIFDNAACV
jgi:hypothetical protein